MSAANPIRGEATIIVDGKMQVLRPTFAALVAAEEELGSLFELVERAAEGKLRLTEMAALFWHCLGAQAELTREQVGEAVLSTGLAKCTPPLRTILGQIVQGAG